MAVLLLVAVRRVCTAYVPGSNTHERRPSTLSTHRHARKRRPGGMGGRLGGVCMDNASLIKSGTHGAAV